MRKTLAAVAVLAMVATVSQAAITLSYSTSGTNVIVTAAEGATTYWEMIVDKTSTRPGRITSFIDKSGASSDTFNYAHRYGLGAGMLDPMDSGEMRRGGKWTLSNWSETASALTYTLSRDLTKDSGTATYSMDFTINIPTVTSQGYDTNIHVDNSWFFDANWVGANGESRAKAVMQLYATADDDEYTSVTHNGVTQGAPANLSVEATVTAADADMAEGSTFTQTLTYNAFDSAYDTATGTYATQSSRYFKGYTDIGTTGAWAGNPGAAGSDRTFTADVDLDISIVPEPATMSLLAIGGIGVLLRRKRR